MFALIIYRMESDNRTRWSCSWDSNQDYPQNSTRVTYYVCLKLGLVQLLPTAREANVFTGVCHSVHNRPYAYSVTAHPCWLLGHLSRCGRYASYWNASLFPVGSLQIYSSSSFLHPLHAFTCVFGLSLVNYPVF